MFHNANLNGKISYVNKEPHFGDRFQIYSDTTVYDQLLMFCGKDRGEQFRLVADIGDSIFKPKYSDTLTLIKGNKIYYCYVREYKG